MNQFSTYAPTPAKFDRQRATWHCPHCNAELARVKEWPKESRLIIADEFIRDQKGIYQKPKKVTRWIQTRPGRDYAKKLQSVIDKAEAEARRLEAIAQETNANSRKPEKPNGPDVQARSYRQYAQIIRGTLNSLQRSDKLWLPETPRSAARRKSLEKLGVRPLTKAEREQRAAQAWTDPKDFTTKQIKEQQIKFSCCGRLHPIPSMRGN